MAANPTQIKSDIDTELANKGYRGVRVTNVIAALKKTLDWVTSAVNGNLSTWQRIADSQPSVSNDDTVYHIGRTIIGRNTDDASNAALQVEGYISASGGFFAANADGTNPTVYSFAGPTIGRWLSNWGVPGLSDLALVNTNLLSGGIGFWQMTSASTRKLLLMLRGGKVGIGTTDPSSSLHVVGAAGHNQFLLEKTYTPTGSADANGVTGSIAWDASYVYVKTAAGWKRSALTTF